MTPSLCALMAEYNRWMNQRLYEAASKLPADEVAKDRGAFFGSILGTLNHIAVADLLWLHRLAKLPELAPIQGEVSSFPTPIALAEQLAESLSGLAELRAKIDEVVVKLASLLTDDLLGRTVHYSNVAGQRQAKKLGLLLQHLFNHQTHHRGQATTLLFQAGVDVGVTDLNALIPSEA
jgi:uncharacterized damage-inducible protein DinB